MHAYEQQRLKMAAINVVPGALCQEAPKVASPDDLLRFGC